GRSRRRRGELLAPAAAQLADARGLDPRSVRPPRPPAAGDRPRPDRRLCRRGEAARLSPALAGVGERPRGGSPALRGVRLPLRRPVLHAHALTRVPLLAGSRLVVVNAPDDATVLRPPPPSDDPLADVVA